MSIPNELDGAKVIQYTSNSMSNQYGTVGILNEKNEIVEKLPITAMAICQYDGSRGYYLFSCDSDWEVIGDFDFATIEDAKESAKHSHKVNDKDWLIR
ncbi:hypothetical protein [Cohnella cholangitidis]|uniref:Uncharacterized protein n=1 Tax=Cohnella cholangitidis TaxID=2598458 RepID=A0A7G5BWI1_9BACL|nr:hypothetical protein [Cohnella cholangitidis]QMV41315.1 hypothetical protein FPL14_09005 [Cohnella cholangitidis]